MSNDSYLTGKLLLAMPTMTDPRFVRSVIYMCTHNKEGAMGIVVNHPLDNIDFDQLVTGLGIKSEIPARKEQICFGGPVEVEKGFILHPASTVRHDTLLVNEDIAVTATLEFLKTIAHGQGPQNKIFALGYAGWDAGQLDDEVLQNTWLTLDADPDLIFNTAHDQKWEKGLEKLGITPAMLSESAGHA